MKRQKEVHDLVPTRLREGGLGAGGLARRTSATTSFFSNSGGLHVPASFDVPQPAPAMASDSERLFKFKDGERVVAALSLDPRVAPKIATVKEVWARRCTRWR